MSETKANESNLYVRQCELCAKIFERKGILNLLDVMECGHKDCLWTFFEVARNHPKKMGVRLFPTKPRGYVTATIDLSHYASNKAVAINERLKGNIQAALIYEKICEDIYNRLPTFARW